MDLLDYRQHRLPEVLERALAALGFERLTEIQARSLPPLRAGRDLIAQSRTGSGKTIAFTLPLLERLRLPERVVQALVLCPTRELCTQVAATIRSAGRFHPNLLVTTVVGGEPVYRQIKSLRHGVHVVVGTPGRVQDLIERECLDLSTVGFAVLDEADRMLDMGFHDAVVAILDRAPSTRQTALFSATFPPTIEELSRRFQRAPERVTVDEAASAIDEVVYEVATEAKLDALARLLATTPFSSALVFCNAKLTCDEVAGDLQARGLAADRIHGDLEQVERDRVMARFRNGSVRLMVATDVAARGLDVAGVDVVVSFDLAKTPDTHLHRIGRTGRAGRAGLAIALVDGRDRDRLAAIESSRGAALPRRVLAKTAGTNGTNRVDTRWETLEISGGRKTKLRPGDILGALTGESGGLPGEAVGKIEIRDHVTYVAIATPFARRALKSLQGGKIKGKRFLVSLVK